MSNNTVNTITTALGLIAGISALLGGSGVISEPMAGTIGGVAVAILGYFVKQPSNSSPGDSL